MFMPLSLKVNGGVMSNLTRIAQKIQENEIQKNNPFRIYDMVRAEIVVENST